MSTPPADIPLSNHATDASDKLGTPSVTIRSDGTPLGTHIALTDGTKLGLVQSIQWGLSIQGYATCTVEVTATPADLKALGGDTTIAVRPADGWHPFSYLYLWYATKIARWLARPAAKSTT